MTIYTKLAYQGSAAAGTGIVIGSNGLVLTNNHVIRGATTLRATDLGNGRTYTATVLGYSVSADVALIKLKNASGLQTATIGGATKVGDAVTAYGNGGGNGVDPTGASGTVRGLGRKITAGDGEGVERAADGPHPDRRRARARRLGRSARRLGRTPRRHERRGVDRLHLRRLRPGRPPRPTRSRSRAPSRSRRQIQKGKTTATVHVGPTAMLGVSISSPDFGGFGGTGASGALVGQVLPGSPADKAGIPAGSLITALGTKRISSPDDLSGAMLRLAPKSAVAVTWVDEFGNHSKATARLTVGPPQ